jgi:hypothetical protein
MFTDYTAKAAKFAKRIEKATGCTTVVPDADLQLVDPTVEIDGTPYHVQFHLDGSVGVVEELPDGRFLFSEMMTATKAFRVLSEKLKRDA